MTDPVSIPLWLVIIGCVLVTWALLDHILIPSVRWYIRRRVNIVIKEVNAKLDLQLPAFKLTKRKILIDRLKSDSKVLEALNEYCRENNVPNEVAIEKMERYAKEIVPSFNAYIYFRMGRWLSKFISRLLYRVRVGFVDEEGLEKVDTRSSVVFVMNHRSNMDYILLAYLAINRVALSFAMGEWGRFWPVQQLSSAMGAFCVRRGSKNTLYRRVLERYVQMATEAGVVQAIFPEGKLTKDGRLCPPRIGLMDYMLRSFDPNTQRDIVFIPVGVNYDRVLEDRTLLLGLDPKAEQKSTSAALKTTLSFIMHNLWLMIRGRWFRFGYAIVNFGAPVSMKEYMKKHKVDFYKMKKEDRAKEVQGLARELMGKIEKVVPVAPVPLIAYVFAEDPEKGFSDLEIKGRVQNLIEEMEKQGARVYIPRSDRDYTVEVGLRMLNMRHIVLENEQLYYAAPDDLEVLQYYANSIAHFIKPKGRK
jgi:glycerol-3-phosphate O-acyltransferase